MRKIKKASIFGEVGEYYDIPHEECGVIGVASQLRESICYSIAAGLSSLQHRGQEAAGIAIYNRGNFSQHKGLGLITQVFSQELINKLQGELGIGHTRYSTTGSTTIENVQPFFVKGKDGWVAFAHNGNLVNAALLRKNLLKQNIKLKSTTDSEVMAEMLVRSSEKTWEERITSCMNRWIGAYSLLIMTSQFIYAIRDPWGMRPLSVGKLKEGGYAAASESCALEALSCKDIIEVNPGEVIVFTPSSLSKFQGVKPSSPLAFCTFEQIYFSRPDSVFDNNLVYDVRRRLGQQLAIEARVDADIVVPIPDSSIPAAIGYAQMANIPYEHGIIRNSYVGRTFIMPTSNERSNGVSLKLTPVKSMFRNKNIVLVDDSIIRGVTVKGIVAKLRDSGVNKIHLRVTCPPIIYPCHMGIDIGEFHELVAHNKDNLELAREFNVDSLHFLSLERMMKAIGSKNKYCNACFTGEYPFDITGATLKHDFEG